MVCKRLAGVTSDYVNSLQALFFQYEASSSFARLEIFNVVLNTIYWILLLNAVSNVHALQQYTCIWVSHVDVCKRSEQAQYQSSLHAFLWTTRVRFTTVQFRCLVQTICFSDPGTCSSFKCNQVLLSYDRFPNYDRALTVPRVVMLVGLHCS